MILDEAPSPEARWYAEPESRGTFSILSSCIITLGLCIWTAVHLNIPDTDNKRTHSKWDPRSQISHQQWRKIGWLVLGMLAPEMVAFTAWVQYRDACSMTRKMEDILKAQSRSSMSEAAQGPAVDIELGSTTNGPGLFLKDGKWSSVHSFYALMGGFVVDISELPEDKKFFPDSRNQLTLAPKTILLLAEHDPSMLDIPSEAELQDKSKASGLAKTIVCLQATWFLTQVVSRLSQGLSISLLELNTAAHAFCALLSYYLWWDKPLDVEEPTKILGKSRQRLFAWLCFSYPLKLSKRIYRDYEHFNLGEAHSPSTEARSPGAEERLPGPEDHSLALEGNISEPGAQPQNAVSSQTKSSTSVDPRLKPDLRSGISTAPSQPTTFRIRDGDAIGRFRFRTVKWSPYRKQGDFTCYKLQDLNRWLLASDGWDEYAAAPEAHLPVAPLRQRMDNWPVNDPLDSLLDPGVPIWKKRYLMDDSRTTIFIAFTVSGLLYGAIHLLAWEGPFHSYIERLLWRFSGILVAASGPLAFAAGAWTTLWGFTHDFFAGNALFELSELLVTILFWIVVPTGIASYYFARTYLVIACFLTLPYLPDSVFQQPRWSTYFPHIN